MARAGVYKWDVKEARDRLIKEGKHPSVDAVRAALGDTGSKSTIHRYLKELEQEGPASSASISDALQALVAQLAARLQHEAAEELLAATARFDADRATLRGQVTAAQEETQRFRAQLERVEIALAGEKDAHAGTVAALQHEKTHVVQLAEQVQGLEQRLTQQLAHATSLEEKHEHARQALEHFRTAAKEQREQEQRRHEQQVQQLQAELRVLNGNLAEKLSQLAQINRDAAALTADNGNLRAQLQESRGEKDRLEKEIARARDAASQSEGRRAALENQLTELKAALADLRGKMESHAQRTRELELAAARQDTEREQALARSRLLEEDFTWLTALANTAGIVGSADAVRRLSASEKTRLEALRTEATRVLGGSDVAELWIHQRCVSLGDIAPIALLNSDEGLKRAMSELGRIEHGLPA